MKRVSLRMSLTAVLPIAGLLSQSVWAAEAKFAWPVPSRATLTETALKKGKTAKMSYDIVLTRAKDGKNLELRFENYQFLNLDGLDLTDAETRRKLGPQLAPVTALASALPTLVINSEGTLQDIVGIEQSVEKALQVLPSDDPKMREALSAMMRSPEMIAQIKEKSGDFWRVWVQTWIGCDTTAGKSETLEQKIAMLGGGAIMVPLIIQSEGSAANAPGHVRFSAQSVLEGEGARKALGSMIKQFAAQIPPREGVKPFSEDMLKSVKRTSKFFVVTNPRTLQPQQAEYEVVTDLTVEDQTKSSVEKRSYSFNWAAPASKPQQ